MSSPFNSRKWLQGLRCTRRVVGWDANGEDIVGDRFEAREQNGVVKRIGKDSIEAKILNALDRYRKAESIHAPGKAYRRW